MPFNLLLLPLLGGFMFFSHWNRTAYFAKRQDKERLLLYSSIWGIFFLAISFFASTLIPYSSTLTSVRTWWAYHTPPIQYSGISSFALLLGLVCPGILNVFWPFNRFWSQSKAGVRAILKYGSQLEKLLYRALVQEKRVMITLTNGKVYIGRVTVSLAPQEATDLFLLPLKSGYREKEKHRVVITTDYERVYLEMTEQEPNPKEVIADFGVVIPVKEVISATLYRDEVHKKYFPHEDLESTPQISASSTKQLVSQSATPEQEKSTVNLKPEPLGMD